MANLLRSLIFLMITSVLLTAAKAHGYDLVQLSHIHLGIIVFIYTIFAQAFVMFYFIGVARLVNNINLILHSENNLAELFEEAPEDLSPYQKKVERFVHEADLCKRQTIPWTILMLVLGMIGFLLGAAHDTGMVDKSTHSGVIYGFIVSMGIGFFRQWYYLGKSHKLLRKVKGLFEIPDGQM